jgi:outer membrane immunogenic protein
MKHLLAGLLLGVTPVPAALAADMPVKAAPPVAVVQTWTGFYFGGHGGYGWGRSNVGYVANDAGTALLFSDFDNRPPFGAPLSASNKLAMNSALGGAQIGYNRQIAPQWLVGIEADIAWSNLHASDSRSKVFAGLVPVSITAEERVKWFGTVRGRLGVLATQNTLAFVTGGLAYARVENSTSLANHSPVTSLQYPGFECLNNSQCFAGSTSRWQAGWTVGGGLEHKWTQNLSLKAEFLYASLRGSSVTASATRPFISPPPTYTANFGRTDLSIVRAGLNVHIPASN